MKKCDLVIPRYRIVREHLSGLSSTWMRVNYYHDLLVAFSQYNRLVMYWLKKNQEARVTLYDKDEKIESCAFDERGDCGTKKDSWCDCMNCSIGGGF